MAGETEKTGAICLDVRPWSRTSHVVTWLAERGRIATLVKGAQRPKSAFLGQYDLNCTCEIVYYARASGELHALRECSPLDMRDGLRRDWRALAVAGYFRRLAGEYAPSGPDCAEWFAALGRALDRLARDPRGAATVGGIVGFELEVLKMLGMEPSVEAGDGAFALRGERRIPVPADVAAFLADPSAFPPGGRTALDAARVIGVFYQFHLDSAAGIRRTVLNLVKNGER